MKRGRAKKAAAHIAVNELLPEYEAYGEALTAGSTRSRDSGCLSQQNDMPRSVIRSQSGLKK